MIYPQESHTSSSIMRIERTIYQSGYFDVNTLLPQMPKLVELAGLNIISHSIYLSWISRIRYQLV